MFFVFEFGEIHPARIGPGTFYFLLVDLVRFECRVLKINFQYLNEYFQQVPVIVFFFPEILKHVLQCRKQHGNHQLLP
ncbi:MAG: hypothetical protein AAB347_08520, partial [Bacteroidota bacterium]